MTLSAVQLYNKDGVAEMKNEKTNKPKMNLPNRLTVLRMCMVPIFMAVMLLPIGELMPEGIAWWLPRSIAAFIFIASSITDMLDGRIARSRGLITDFGKFLDPLADKTLVIGALLACTVAYCYQIGWALSWVTFIVIFREFAVTSMRLVVVNTSGIVVAASMLGKIKTVSQIVGISIILLEPVAVTPLVRMFYEGYPEYFLSYIGMIVMTVTTAVSGFDYIRSYWKYVDSNK